MSEEQTIPGTHLKRRATSRLLLALLLLFVVWVAITTAFMQHNGRPLVALAGLSGLVLMGLILVSRGVDFHEEAFDHLASYWREVSRERDNFRAAAKGYMEEYDRALQFIRCFRPTQEVVDAILRYSASRVREAYQFEVRLQRFGMEGVSQVPDVIRDGAEHDDLEERVKEVSNELQNRLKGAQTMTRKAINVFWVQWNLAKGHGYELKQSWKPYAGLPWEEKESKS